MTRFIIRRIIRGLIALILFQSLLFVLMQAVPYDFSVFYFGNTRLRELVRASLGLNLPWHVQYFNWLTGFFRFDLGISFLSWPVPVSQILSENAPRTLLLFFTGVTIAYLFGIWLGKEIAWRRDSLFESAATITGVAAYTSFAPWLGFLVLNVFAWWLGGFPWQQPSLGLPGVLLCLRTIAGLRLRWFTCLIIGCLFGARVRRALRLTRRRSGGFVS